MTSSNSNSHSHHVDERRRHDWQQNDRRKKWPWVVDISDRRSGRDRRVDQQNATTW